MTALFRACLRGLLRFAARYPALKRFLVDTIYRLPAFDAALRTIVLRVNHPDARLDVDASSLPESSRHAYNRMRERRRA